MPVIQVAESLDVSLSQEIPSDIWSGGITSKNTSSYFAGNRAYVDYTIIRFEAWLWLDLGRAEFKAVAF